MRTYDPPCTEDIRDTAAKMIRKAKLYGEPIKAVFNGIHLVAYATQHPDEIVTDYYDQCNTRREDQEAEHIDLRKKIIGWIDMIENCAGVPSNHDSLPQMLLHEMRAAIGEAS